VNGHARHRRVHLQSSIIIHVKIAKDNITSSCKQML
jgi:hypothetical protein